MTQAQKPILQIVLQEEDNYCAKCCKTRQVIERMLEAVPNIKENVEINYIYLSPEKIEKGFRHLTLPVVLINEQVFSEGHVPIIKKLSRELLNLLAQYHFK